MKVEQGNALRLGAVALCAFALVACGGNDDNGGSGASAGGSTGASTGGTSGGAAPAVVAGTVDAQFMPTTGAARYIAMTDGSFSQGVLGAATQESNGAFRVLGKYQADSSTQVGAMSGNATFALGTWIGKIADASSGADVPSSNGLAYAVYNQSGTVGPDGVLNCTPRVTSSRNATGAVDTLTGTAGMTIVNGIVTLDLNMTLKLANGGESPLAYNRTFSDGISGMSYTGAFLTSPVTTFSYGVGVADGANDGHVVVVPWKTPSAGGLAQGIAVLECSRPA
ncbi:MAG: hypothetical protein JO067_02665 [Cupriavidus sp.]|nr:hypothetical protein [Cupriavidus sp.]